MSMDRDDEATEASTPQDEPPTEPKPDLPNPLAYQTKEGKPGNHRTKEEQPPNRET
jgi:hypothetical protein